MEGVSQHLATETCVCVCVCVQVCVCALVRQVDGHGVRGSAQSWYCSWECGGKETDRDMEMCPTR